jgi:hypothetical protein
MTTQEMIEWFDVLQDKYGSPYFDTDHKLLFLNRAQFEYVKQLFPDNEQGIINIEYNSSVTQNVAPLIYELTQANMATDGTITIEDLVTDLETISGDSDAKIFKILSIEIARAGIVQPVKYLRHNDKGEFERNYFKKPSTSNYRYLLQNNALQFRPVDQLSTIHVTVLKAPKQLVISPSPINSELPDDVHNEIVAYALQFAGVASRDEILSSMNMAQLPQK